MKDPTHEDRRVRKTKKQLCDALARILCQKPLKSITVREIAEEADINRGTFYLHYKDVADMAEHLQKEFTERFNVIVERFDPEGGNRSLLSLLTDVVVLLEEHADLAEVLLGKNGDAAFPERLKASVRSRCFADERYMARFASKADFEYYFSYVASGVVGITYTWLSGGRNETPEELAHIVNRMICGGVASLKAK